MDDRNYGGTALESRVQFAPETAPFYLYPAFHQLIRGPTCLSALPPLFPFIPHRVSSLNLASFYFARILRSQCFGHTRVRARIVGEKWGIARLIYVAICDRQIYHPLNSVDDSPVKLIEAATDWTKASVNRVI